jgi:hypothetical protein
MRRLQCVLLVLLLATSARAARANALEGSDPSDPLTVELLTIGPGRHPFLKFGHNALRIRDARDASDLVYNFGTFSFTSSTLMRDFWKGRLHYWLSRQGMRDTIVEYAVERRSLAAQLLALSPAEKQELKSQLDYNALPSHRNYRYDYLYDNCSTRLRDAINRVTHGQLRAALRTPAMQPLRAHVLRATADYFLQYLVLSIILGPRVDRPADRWAEAFLPEMLADAVNHTSIRATDGTLHPLAQSAETILPRRNTRPPRPPRWTMRFVASGSLGGLLLWALALLSRRLRAASVLLGTIVTLGGLLVGLVGLGLASLWAFTDHVVTYRNQNLLLLSPLALALPWFGMRILVLGAKAIAAMRWLSVPLLGSAILGLIAKILPLEWQDNAALIGFFLPCWLGLYLATAAHPRIRSLELTK